MDYTRDILDSLRKTIDEARRNDKTNLATMFENEMVQVSGGNNGDFFVIKAGDAQFGSVKASQEDAIKKTIGNVVFKNDSLKYIPSINDIVLNGEIGGLGVRFQFRFQDASGNGCYIWCDSLQLSDQNTRTIEKIRDAFLNWKQSLVDDGDLFEKLHKEATKE